MSHTFFLPTKQPTNNHMANMKTLFISLQTNKCLYLYLNKSLLAHISMVFKKFFFLWRTNSSGQFQFHHTKPFCILQWCCANKDQRLENAQSAVQFGISDSRHICECVHLHRRWLLWEKRYATVLYPRKYPLVASALPLKWWIIVREIEWFL